MARTVEELVVEWKAKTEEFNRKLDGIMSGTKKVNTELERVGKAGQENINKLNAALTRLMSGAAIVALGTALSRMSSQVEQAALDLSNVAANANVGVETLQELRFAAEQVGAQASDMDAVLLNLNKRLGEARAGSEEAAKQFRALGLEQLVKNGADTETMLRAIADQLRQIEDPAVADAFAMKILGDNAKVLNDLLRDGSGKLSEYAKQAREVGIKTKEQVEELKTAALETKKLNAFFNQLAADVDTVLLRSLKGATLAIQDLATAMRRFREENERQKNQGFLGSSVNQILEDARNFGKVPAPPTIGFEALDLGKPQFKPRPLGPLDGGGAAAKLAENLKRLREENERLVESLEFERDIMNLSAVDQEVQIALRKLNEHATDEQVTKTEALTRALFENAQALRDNAELEAFAARIKEQFGSESEKLAEHVERLNEALAQGKITLEEYRAALADATKSEGLREFEEAWENIGEQAKHGLADVLIDIAANTRDAGEAVAEFVKQLGFAVAKALILKAITDAIGGGGGEGAAGSALAGVILGRAGGGPVNAGTPYWVGEHGRELMIPRASGSIVPGNRVGGGVSISYAPVINAQSGVTRADVAMALAQDRAEFARQIPAIVNNGMYRGSIKGR